MEWSAQRVRAKARAAVKRREDAVEAEEIESGELNLIPYLDMVTNLMLFLLASVTAGIILVQIDTQLPDRAINSAIKKPPQTPPDEQELKLIVAVVAERPGSPAHVLIASDNGLEGTLSEPKATFPLTGKEGATCDGNYMCESNKCDRDRNVCVPSTDVRQYVFDFRAINKALFEIANRRYTGKQRKYETYRVLLMADREVPYSTITSVMSALRCKLPDFGQEPKSCLLPTEDPKLKLAPDPIALETHVYDTTRAVYDPNKMALFPDILFSPGISQ